jgi:diaminopimelate decarboxylase
MNIIGISFHVGSGACNPDAFMDAITQTRELYDSDRIWLYYGFS